jgi:hypothetical protein
MDATAAVMSELAEIKAQLAELASLVKPAGAHVLTVAQAMRLTGHGSDSAFYRWTAENNVKPCRRGGYLQEHIEHGLRIAAARKKL